MGGSLRHYFYALLAFIVACVLAYVLINIARDGETAHGQSIEPSLVLTLPPTKWDGKLLELDKEALDKAYVAKVQQLFDVYVREGLTSSEGAIKGHANAQRAWLQAQRAIEIKEQALEEREKKK